MNSGHLGLPVEKKRADPMKIGKMATDEKESIAKTTMEGIDHGGMTESIVAAAEMVTNTIAVVSVQKALEKMIIITSTKRPEVNGVVTGLWSFNVMLFW